jgi:hypothetical protein
MSQIYNIYCDESCHLEHDHQDCMILGAVWCPTEKTREIADRLREIKARHHVSRLIEAKWNKVSGGRLDLYTDLIDYFFDDDDLHFRGLIATGKSRLTHAEYGQTHDDWYYKMYFLLLAYLLSPKERYRIYLDIKDTRGGAKVQHLRQVLCNSKYDFSLKIVEWIQLVRSHEAEIFQLADLLIGAVSYANRGLQTSPAKMALVQRIRRRSGYSLTRTTLLHEPKFNLFRWEPTEIQV